MVEVQTILEKLILKLILILYEIHFSLIINISKNFYNINLKKNKVKDLSKKLNLTKYIKI
jgi:hypothetical protein